MAATSRSKFFSLFQRARTAVVGMVHVQALPGALNSACYFTHLYNELCGTDDEYINP